MPQIANIVLADGQSTPVNHTFTPSSIKDGVAVFYDRAKSVVLEQPYVTIKTNLAKNPKGISSVRATVNVPRYDSVSGKVIGYQSATIEYRIAPQGTKQDRDDLVAYVKGLTATSLLQGMAANVEALY